jgi:hypothetical protein
MFKKPYIDKESNLDPFEFNPWNFLTDILTWLMFCFASRKRGKNYVMIDMFDKEEIIIQNPRCNILEKGFKTLESPEAKIMSVKPDRKKQNIFYSSLGKCYNEMELREPMVSKEEILWKRDLISTNMRKKRKRDSQKHKYIYNSHWSKERDK